VIFLSDPWEHPVTGRLQIGPVAGFAFASMLNGHGTLRNECSIELRTDAISVRIPTKPAGAGGRLRFGVMAGIRSEHPAGFVGIRTEMASVRSSMPPKRSRPPARSEGGR
jgi:hypothetical protein